jgi:hypothetical protein
MLVPLLPQWPTASPYEVFEGTSAPEHPPSAAAEESNWSAREAHQ